MWKGQKEWMKAYSKKYYQEHKAELLKRNAEWRKKHKEEFEAHRKTWISRNPYFKHYRSAQGRCRGVGLYAKKGIKFLMTAQEVKALWERDKAHLLKRPSIDRRDPEGHYEMSNCRFIELEENNRRARQWAKTILTREDILKIREHGKRNKFTAALLAKKYKVSARSIRNIFERRSWKTI